MPSAERSSMPCYDDLPDLAGLVSSDEPWAHDPFVEEVHGGEGWDATLIGTKGNPPGVYDDAPLGEFCLQLLTRDGGQFDADVGAGSFELAGATSGMLVLAPPDTDGRYTSEFDFDVQVVGLPASLFAEAQEAMGYAYDMPDMEPLLRGAFRDRTMTMLIERMFALARADDLRALEASMLSRTLAAGLLARAGRLKPDLHPVLPLSTRELALAQEAIEACLLAEARDGAKLRLADLADAADRNIYQFGAAFRSAAGTSLSAHVERRRHEVKRMADSDRHERARGRDHAQGTIAEGAER